MSVITYAIDTNIIIKDFSRYIQTLQPIGLMIAAKLGEFRLFASTVVRDEIPERLERVISRRGIDLSEVREILWRDYAPLITFLDPSDLKVLSPRALIVEAVNADDVPTGKIIDLIRPHIALSENHHLAAYRPAGPEWTKFATAARDKSRRDANFVVIHAGGGITIWLGAAVVRSLVSLILRANKQILLGVGLTLIIGDGLLVARQTSRGWLKEKAHQNERGHSQQVSLQRHLSFFMYPSQHLAETLLIPVAKSKMTLVLNSNSLNSELERQLHHRYQICVRAERDNEQALRVTSEGMFVRVSKKQVAYDFSKELMPE